MSKFSHLCSHLGRTEQLPKPGENLLTASQRPNPVAELATNVPEEQSIVQNIANKYIFLKEKLWSFSSKARDLTGRYSGHI